MDATFKNSLFNFNQFMRKGAQLAFSVKQMNIKLKAYLTACRGTRNNKD